MNNVKCKYLFKFTEDRFKTKGSKFLEAQFFN